MKNAHTKPIANNAFLANPGLQKEATARLAEAIEQGLLTPTATYEWDAETGAGNMTGLAARAPDVQAYEAALGLPHTLGATHEQLIRATQIVLEPESEEGQDEEQSRDEFEPEDGGNEADKGEGEGEGPSPLPVVEIDPALKPHVTAWLRAIVPGSDLSLALLAFQRRLAAALLDGLPLLGQPAAETRQLVQAWRALLAVEPQGEPAGQPWEQLRHEAGELAKKSRHAQRLVAELIEAAGWPYADAAVDWPAAWEAFVQGSARLDVDKALDEKTAAIVRAGNEAWEAFERRAAAEPTMDIFSEADNDTALEAVNQPEVQQLLGAAQQVHARPLMLALLAHFEACMAVSATPAVQQAPGAVPATASSAGAAEQAVVAVVVGDSAYQSTVLSAQGVVLVDFWAPWCGPCVQFMPSFMKLAELYAGRVKFVKVNLDDNEELCKSLNIRALPTVIVYEGGKPLERINTLNRGRICAVLDARLA